MWDYIDIVVIEGAGKIGPLGLAAWTPRNRPIGVIEGRYVEDNRLCILAVKRCLISIPCPANTIVKQSTDGRVNFGVQKTQYSIFKHCRAGKPWWISQQEENCTLTTATQAKQIFLESVSPAML